jgi:hypothetical protein
MQSALRLDGGRVAFLQRHLFCGNSVHSGCGLEPGRHARQMLSFFASNFSLAMDVLQIRGTARFLAEENGAFKQTVADTWEMSRHALFWTGWLVLW